MVEYIPMVGWEGCGCCAGLRPLGSATSGVKVAECPVSHGIGKTIRITGLRSDSCNGLVHSECKWFTAVGDTLPPFLFGDHFRNYRGEFGVGGRNESGVDIAIATKECSDVGQVAVDCCGFDGPIVNTRAGSQVGCIQRELVVGSFLGLVGEGPVVGEVQSVTKHEVMKPAGSKCPKQPRG